MAAFLLATPVHAAPARCSPIEESIQEIQVVLRHLKKHHDWLDAEVSRIKVPALMVVEVHVARREAVDVITYELAGKPCKVRVKRTHPGPYVPEGEMEDK